MRAGYHVQRQCNFDTARGLHRVQCEPDMRVVSQYHVPGAGKDAAVSRRRMYLCLVLDPLRMSIQFLRLSKHLQLVISPTVAQNKVRPTCCKKANHHLIQTLADYMNGFKCNVTGSTSEVALAQPQIPRRCGADPDDGKADAVPGNCTYGAKQPFYWFQAEENTVRFQAFLHPALGC